MDGMKQTIIPQCSRKSLMFQEAHSPQLLVLYHLSTLEHSYCRFSSVHFPSPSPSPAVSHHSPG